jgi:hypothetical protein
MNVYVDKPRRDVQARDIKRKARSVLNAGLDADDPATSHGDVHDPIAIVGRVDHMPVAQQEVVFRRRSRGRHVPVSVHPWAFDATRRYTARVHTLRFLSITAALMLVAASSLVVDAQPDPSMSPYTIALWGDVPYSDTQATTGVPNLIADINDSDIEFSVNDGDLKAGSGTPGSATPTDCGDAMYAQALGYLNSLKKPAMFTPGDNDWTDCDRPANGGYNSLERLDSERKLFFSTSTSLGQQKLQQEIQSTPNCPGSSGPTRCVENRRWTFNNVTYATLNVQGSCNNLCDTNPDPEEFAGRNAADIAWLQQTFEQAKTNGAVAVMLISQADPGFDPADPTRAPLRDSQTLAQTDNMPDGFKDFLVALRTEVIDFRRPVVYVHGDSHYFRVDKPLLDDKGRRLENFTRLETFGDNQNNGNNDVHWVRVLVDPSSRDVFAFQPQIVPANRTAVPAP